MKHLALLVLAVAGLVFPGITRASQWVADKNHSQVKFSVSHMVVSEVTGMFKQFDVTMDQPTDDFTRATIQAVIKANSVDTGIEGRDKHLRSDAFLNAEKYPDITFKSTSIEKTGDDTYKITGDLTIRDVTKQVVLDAKLNGIVDDPKWGGTRAGFKATTSINRFDYNVKWDNVIESGALVAGKTVDITLLMELIKQKEAAH